MKQDFNLVEAFSRIDLYGRGFITMIDLNSYLNQELGF